MPRVVYAGEISGTCLSRFNALRAIEPDIAVFDLHRCFPTMSRPRRFLEQVLHYGPYAFAANRRLVALCEAVEPDVIWIDKGEWLHPRTIGKLKRQGALLVQHNTDAMFPARFLMRLQRRSIVRNSPYFDLFLTTNRRDLAYLQNHLNGRARLTHLGYDHERFFPANRGFAELAKTGARLLFIGHHEERTERFIVALHREGLPVRVHGTGWKNAKARELRDIVSPEVSDSEYVAQLRNAEIGLSFFSELNYNETAGRSFEIPACGTFLLAMRSSQHLEAFVEAKEAEFFGDVAELIAKARYYLEHPAERRKIALAGEARCRTSGYSYYAIMLRDWAHVIDLVAKPTRP